MTQNEMILEYLRSHDDITQFDAFVHIGCSRLGVRIFDLKKLGYPIETKMKKVTKANGETTYVGAYSLRKDGKDETGTN